MNCLFIFNPNSGKGKILKYKDYIIQKLKTKYEVVDCYETKYKNNATEFVQNFGEKYDTIVISGGDGTLNEVINGIKKANLQINIGYIPTGTVNDVASSLKIPKNIKKAVDVIVNGKIFAHDIFKVNDRYGIYVCTAGMFTETSYSTSQSTKKNFGKLAYLVHGVKLAFNSSSMHIKLKYDGKIVDGIYSLFIAINSRSVAGVKLNKKAVLNDGLVDVALVKMPKNKKFSLISLFTVLNMFIFGIEHSKHKKNVTYLKLSNFDVCLNSKSKINLDGEHALSGSFSFKVIQEGVRIFVP